MLVKKPHAGQGIALPSREASSRAGASRQWLCLVETAGTVLMLHRRLMSHMTVLRRLVETGCQTSEVWPASQRRPRLRGSAVQLEQELRGGDRFEGDRRHQRRRTSRQQPTSKGIVSQLIRKGFLQVTTFRGKAVTSLPLRVGLDTRDMRFATRADRPSVHLDRLPLVPPTILLPIVRQAHRCAAEM